jgi:hypothetical protein
MPEEQKFPIENSDELFCEFNVATQRSYLLWLQGWPVRGLSNDLSRTGTKPLTLKNWCSSCRAYRFQNHEHDERDLVLIHSHTACSEAFPDDEPLFSTLKAREADPWELSSRIVTRLSAPLPEPIQELAEEWRDKWELSSEWQLLPITRRIPTVTIVDKKGHLWTVALLEGKLE